MVATTHGHQPAQRLGWAAPAYLKKESANPHSGSCMSNTQNDGKPDRWLGVRLGSWNVGSICGRGTEVCEELRERKVDVCCLQEVRWRGQGARYLGTMGRRYKLWW